MTTPEHPPTLNPKVACKEWRCGWHGLFTQALEAVNPFNQAFNIYACPKCLEVQDFTVCCDEPGCWEPVCAGTPTKDGYRQTCSTHAPERSLYRPS